LKKITLFWFRRDLRLEDNVGLNTALHEGNNVLPLFIFDTDILQRLQKNDARVNFLHNRIEELNRQLQPKGKKIHVFQGKPLDIINSLTQQLEVGEVFTNRDYEPYSVKRDHEIEKLLTTKNIRFSTSKDHVIFEKDEVVKADGTPYRVYTPYSRVWMKKFESTTIHTENKPPPYNAFTTIDNHQNPTLEDLGFTDSNQPFPKPNTTKELIENYEANRNTPSVSGTSKIGAHLRFGTISVRQAVVKALQSKNETFLKELIWREFFMQILWHFPDTEKNSFKPQYDRIEWRNDPKEFKRWCEGKTGYPFVDAGMRELNETGFMHNRVRMLVGSFLCKHLLIDWRWGEAYFAEKLLDYEMASNVGNWQWVAGCGVDAAPYFRIFNPTEQIKKFDKNHIYIKRWVPDYESPSYPSPIVDHKAARDRCLDTYKSALNR
jgi:deoxyribodipyrimidine photo-lyase